MTVGTPTLDSWERELLEVALLVPECLSRMREEISTEQLTSPAARAILTRCYEFARYDHIIIRPAAGGV